MNITTIQKSEIQFQPIQETANIHKIPINQKIVFRDVFTFGLKQKDNEYFFSIPLNKEKLDPKILKGISQINKAVKTHILENQKALPAPFNKMTQEQLAEAISTLEVPGKEEMCATLFARVAYYKKESKFLTRFMDAQKKTIAPLQNQPAQVSFTLNLKSILILKEKIKVEAEIYELRYDSLVQKKSFL